MGEVGERSDQDSEYYPGSDGKSGKGAESVYSRQLKVLAGGPEPLHKRLVVTLDEQNQFCTIYLYRQELLGSVRTVGTLLETYLNGGLGS